jgi:hypothetical protein
MMGAPEKKREIIKLVKNRIKVVKKARSFKPFNSGLLTRKSAREQKARRPTLRNFVTFTGSVTGDIRKNNEASGSRYIRARAKKPSVVLLFICIIYLRKAVARLSVRRTGLRLDLFS